DEVGTGGVVALGVNARAGEGGDDDVGAVRPLDQVGRGRAEGAGDEADPVGEGDVEQGLVALGRDGQRAAPAPDQALGLVIQLGYAVATQDVVDERLLLRRQQLAHGLPV